MCHNRREKQLPKTRHYQKVVLKAGPSTKCQQVLMGGGQREGPCQSHCAGGGEALRGLNAEFSYSVLLQAAVCESAADTILWIHTTSLWGLSHTRRERDCRRRYRKKTQALSHGGSQQPIQSCTWERGGRLMLMQFIFSQIIGEHQGWAAQTSSRADD